MKFLTKLFCNLYFFVADVEIDDEEIKQGIPDPPKYDQEHESIEQEEDVTQEGNAVEEKEKDESHESEGEGKAAEKSGKGEDTAGLFCVVDSKTSVFSLRFTR